MSESLKLFAHYLFTVENDKAEAVCELNPNAHVLVCQKMSPITGKTEEFLGCVSAMLHQYFQ